ncbi:MAG: hypothetical protein Q8Q09_24280 [Deltaproteobacteria bacterium]|nr:hypothetical protein [Deltaproteobacteria bacterium]
MKNRSIVHALVVASSLLFARAAVAQEHGAHSETHQAEVGHGEAAHGEGHAAAHHGPDSINWTQFGGTHADHAGVQKPNPPPLVASVINFALLAAILFFAVRRAINPSLATQRAAIESEFAEAQRLRAEAEAMHREYSDRLTHASDEFAKLRSDVEEAAQREASRVIDEAKSRAERMQGEGQALIEQEVRSLRVDLLRESVEAAVKSAEEAVKRGINAQDQARLADAFVDGLEKSFSSKQGVA